MSLDQYSLCPGGTGKKLKFCCPDQLEDLSAIDRMLEGQQFRAALEQLDRMEKSQRASGKPIGACVYSLRSLVLRTLERWDEASIVADAFLAAYPDNPVAIAEKAIHVIRTEGATAAVPLAQRAFESEQLSAGLSRVYGMLRILGMGLWAQRDYLATLAVYQILLSLRPDDPTVQETYAKLIRLRDVPIWAKDVRLIRVVKGLATDSADAIAFQGALEKMAKAQWIAAAGDFESLAERTTSVACQAAAWYNVGVLRAWLATPEQAIESLRKYATYVDVADSAVTADDAAEAEALAIFLRPEGIGDAVSLYGWTHPVRDPQTLDETLVKSKRLSVMQIDWSQFRTEGNPAPKSGYLICERAVPEDVPEGGDAADLAARVLGRILVFGRETDRPARIEVMEVAAPDRSAVLQLLAEELGGLLDPAENEVEIDQVSLIVRILQQGYRLPRNMDPDQVAPVLKRIVQGRVDEDWLTRPIGCLDGPEHKEGMTLPEAAKDPAMRSRVAAVILWLRNLARRTDSDLDVDAIATRLGVPLPEPIDPTTLDGPVVELPLNRMERIDVSKLGDQELSECFQRLMAVEAEEEIRKYALEAISRESLASEPILLMAYDQLVRNSGDPSEAFDYLARGRT
ncbi:MAG: hypothetical protein Q4C47_02360, partial [Planctomycetia bacterium]|nr:hypothetical protein [Planctomycetia bacterium]